MINGRRIRGCSAELFTGGGKCRISGGGQNKAYWYYNLNSIRHQHWWLAGPSPPNRMSIKQAEPILLHPSIVTEILMARVPFLGTIGRLSASVVKENVLEG